MKVDLPYKVVLFILAISFFFGNTLISNAQPETHFIFNNSTFISSSETPFWLWANRDGKVIGTSSFLNLTNFNAELSGAVKNNANFHYTLGANLVGGISNESYLQMNRLFAGINFKGWQLEAGTFYDDLQFYGLSTTNGNLARSRNARPYPKIRFSTANFKPVPGVGNWLFFRAEYDEGLLNDNRYVENTHLHHKSLYFKIAPSNNWDLRLGLEHHVMWGGNSINESVGQLPDGFKSYFRYIFGMVGSEDFELIDQVNIAGNHYGTYQLKLTRKFSTFLATLNISHPFEDLSGVNLRNWPDNLVGLHVEFTNREKLITDILYEFTNTRQQGITDSTFRWDELNQNWKRIYTDDYFNNNLYNSGVTYYKMAMCSPLFAPVNVQDGISYGFISNRFYSHHLAVQGKIAKDLAWRSLTTYSHHLGTYFTPFKEQANQLSILFNFNYSGKILPFELGFSVASDFSKMIENRVGIQLSVSRSW